MKIGYIGLGKMGKNMVYRLLEAGVEVVAWNRSPEPLTDVEKAGAQAANDLSDLISRLETPRLVWLMLPQGQPTDEILDQLIPHLDPDDMVIDGANAFYKDTLRRAEILKKHQIRFMDIGVSGGPSGARSGACLMIGGEKQDFDRIKWLVEVVAAPQAFAHLGQAGAGHFAKMVHNGIEYGMMQAIAEGAAVLKASEFPYQLAEVFRIYNNRSVIESRLVEWGREAFEEDEKLENISSVISHTGEGEWTVKTASELDVDVPVIQKSFEVRVESASEPENFRNKVVSALRGKFGGHAVNKLK